MPVRGKLRKMMLRYDFSPVSRPIQNGELVDRREHVGDEVPGHVHGVDQEVAVLDADVDVGAEDEQLLGQVGEILPHAHVALERRDLLGEPGRERMGAGRGDHQPVLAGELHHVPPEPHQLGPHLGRGAADLGADLDHRLVQLRLHLAEDEMIAARGSR